MYVSPPPFPPPRFNVGFSVTVPHLDLASLESGYHGLVKENETLVEVTPRIKAIGGDICSFRIVNKHHGEAPFEVKLKFIWHVSRYLFGLRFPVKDV
jgi:hypothetical protein